MDYNKLISITGMGGLYEMISSKKDGAIVKNLEDGNTQFIANRNHNFSHLESIEVYTTADNVNLTQVLVAMQASTVAKPDAKDAKAVKAYFEKVYPTMDFDKVYNSDLKKMVKWLSILEANKVEIKLTETTEDAADEIKEVKENKPKVITPKAAAPKKAAAQKINAPRKMA